MRQQLSGYSQGLRQATTRTLTAYRAERARLNAAWHGARNRRVEPPAPPVTLVDPRESLPPALTALVGPAAASAPDRPPPTGHPETAIRD